MICVNKELIKEELEKDGFKYKKLKLSNKFIDRLFNHYYCKEMCQNFYDSEPEFEDEELYNMYLDYQDTIRLTGLTIFKFLDIAGNEIPRVKFSEEEHTKEELKEAYFKVQQMYKDYEDTRIRFCNWQEPFFKGNWGYTQEYVDDLAKDKLKEIQKMSIKRNGRIYWTETDDQIRIYFYSRDFEEADYWFIFLKRHRRLK